MKRGRKEGLQIRLFHDFSLSFNGKPLLFSRSSSTKFIPLLALLFLYRDYAAPKKELLDNLYGSGMVINRNKSLNSVIYRLNDWLVKQGIPEGNGVAIQDGMVLWQGSLPVWVDVTEFERKAELALQEVSEKKERSEQTALLEAAESAYEGEILGEFSTELWVITKNMEYKKMYEELVMTLKERFFQKGDYLKAAAVCKRASGLYPFDSWQMHWIECLQEASEYEAALQVYQDMARLYYEELGLTPGKDMLERLRLLEERQMSQERNLERFGEALFAGQTEGALCVGYPGFLDICRHAGRLTKDGSNPFALMLLTLERRGQGRLPERRVAPEMMDRLRETLRRILPDSAVFSKSRENQFLILIEEREEAGMEIFDRLLREWKREAGGGSDIRYSFLSMNEMQRRSLGG